MKDSLVVGFVGRLASGKGTAAAYLKKQYKAETFRFSSILRDVMERLGIEQTVTNIIDTSTKLRSAFGEDLLSRVIVKDVIAASSKIVAVDGIRRPADATYLKELPHFVLVSVEVDEEIRYKRFLERSENPGDAQMTLLEFNNLHTSEANETIPEVMKEATEIITNNGDEQGLFDQVDALIKKYGASS